MIEKMPFGVCADGTPVHRYRIFGEAGAYVDVLDYGATIQSIVVPDGSGCPRDVVLGYDSLTDYEQGQVYFGATIGRHANRIGNGQFTLGGTTYQLEKNSGPNHSHGGMEGFDRRMFTAEILGDELAMKLCSPDGDQGYPGTLDLTVTFSFSDNALKIHYLATTDRDTVVNLTNHSYFDLSGGQNPLGQRLRMAAEFFTENDENTLPTGRILPVRGTAFDFTEEKTVGRDLGNYEEQLLLCRGYDHNYVLENRGTLQAFAWLHSPETGITMTAETDMPGVQLYSGNYVEDRGKGGRNYGPRDGICLETQYFPNAMAIEAFEKPILRAGAVYDHTTVYRFGVEA